jgi:hypothetical protein
VAGGPSGQARVYDARTGALLATYRLADPAAGSFNSDVVVTGHAAYYTDAFRPQLYVIPLRRRGALPAPDRVRTVKVSGDAAYQSGANVFNLNGIAVVEGRLVTAQTVTGELFTLNPHNGRTRRIPVVDEAGRPATVPGADGFVARGRTLVIAQNFPESIAVVRLSRDLSHARLLRTLTDARPRSRSMATTPSRSTHVSPPRARRRRPTAWSASELRAGSPTSDCGRSDRHLSCSVGGFVGLEKGLR